MKHIIKIFSVLVICVAMPAIVHAAAMTQAERIDNCLAAVNESTNEFQNELKTLITEDTLARTEADGGEAGLRNLVKSIHIPITSIFSQKIKDIDGCQNAINDLQSRSKLKLHLFGNKKYAYYINSNELNKYRRVKYYIWLSWNNTYKPGTIIKKQDLEDQESPTEPFWKEDCMNLLPMMHILVNGNSFDLAKNLSEKLTDYKGYFQAMHFNWLKLPDTNPMNMFKGILSCYMNSKSTFTGFRDPTTATEGVNAITEILQANQQCQANTKNGGTLVLYIGILNNTSYSPNEALDKSEPNATEFTIISGPHRI